MNPEDRLVSSLPIHYSNTLVPNVHIHQFPLLNRPLQVPPSAALSGKRIKARHKSGVKRLEIHVPVDTRPEVWNSEKSKELGAARVEDDKEKNQDSEPVKSREEDPRLSEVRLQSEQLLPTGAYMLGILRDGHLHLHPISEVHQLRPTLTYLDTLTRKSRRGRGAGSDSDSDDGPPPDPDEPAPAPPPKKEKKSTTEAKEVQVAARKNEEKGGLAIQGGLSTVRRDMLLAMRAEEDEAWEDLEYHDAEAGDSGEAYEALFSREGQDLVCKTDVTEFLKSIKGL
ncbi:hypothetical protein DENSPDRAFT_814241 [Dentipellis sp. KUC8613]|nr:hypothetical protein DENSPDRAFT_814241 [Dentipellis sp. KUC8613]